MDYENARLSNESPYLTIYFGKTQKEKMEPATLGATLDHPHVRADWRAGR